MKTLLLKSNQLLRSYDMRNLMHITILLLLWFTLPKVLKNLDPFTALVDPGIWQLLLLSLISFLGICLISWQLLALFCRRMAIPKFNMMVPQFKELSLCTQFGFYWASFALLMLVAMGCLMAVV